MTGGKSNRRRGDYFERQTRAALTARGWVIVRAAGSLGVADLCALRAGNTPLLVSCKISGILRPAERAALLDAARIGGARAVVAMRSQPGHVNLAAVVATSARPIPLETLAVPTRPR